MMRAPARPKSMRPKSSWPRAAAITRGTACTRSVPTKVFDDRPGYSSISRTVIRDPEADRLHHQGVKEVTGDGNLGIDLDQQHEGGRHQRSPPMPVRPTANPPTNPAMASSTGLALVLLCAC